MSQTLSPSLARWYGMARVARVWKFSRASVLWGRATAGYHFRSRGNFHAGEVTARVGFNGPNKARLECGTPE